MDSKIFHDMFVLGLPVAQFASSEKTGARSRTAPIPANAARRDLRAAERTAAIGITATRLCQSDSWRTEGQKIAGGSVLQRSAREIRCGRFDRCYTGLERNTRRFDRAAQRAAASSR